MSWPSLVCLSSDRLFTRIRSSNEASSLNDTLLFSRLLAIPACYHGNHSDSPPLHSAPPSDLPRKFNQLDAPIPNFIKSNGNETFLQKLLTQFAQKWRHCGRGALLGLSQGARLHGSCSTTSCYTVLEVHGC